MTNITCMQPTELGLTSAGMSYILDRQTTRPTTTLAWMDMSTIGLREDGSYMDAKAVTATLDACLETDKATTAAVV